jgi:hypothetical protein
MPNLYGDTKGETFLACPLRAGACKDFLAPLHLQTLARNPLFEAISLIVPTGLLLSKNSKNGHRKKMVMH